MTTIEKKSISLLASLFSLRMLALFMLLPVLTLYTRQWTGATPTLIGLTLGIYGLTQALFQIPFACLSDKIGRQPVILIGLSLLAVGGLIAAYAVQVHSLYILILGRALQGAGAIGSTLLAFVADLTRPLVRSKAMASIGLTIGLSFMLALIFSPLISAYVGLSGLFIFSVISALLGMVILFKYLPHPIIQPYYHLNESLITQLIKVIKNHNLICLNIGILSLHAIFAACFLLIPALIQDTMDLSSTQSWRIYGPTLLLGILGIAPFIHSAKSFEKIKKYSMMSVIILFSSVIGLKFFLYPALIGFFGAFTLLEALLPSWTSIVAPENHRGAALGIYSSAQFLGIFMGGAIGGHAASQWGDNGILIFCTFFFLLFIGAMSYVKRY